MATAVGRYFLDGIDMFTAYGYIPASGSDDILKIPAIKLPLSHDWPDESGTEWDLVSARQIQDNTINLKGFLVASSEADFWTKYNALKSVLLTTGVHDLSYKELESGIASVKVFYKECSELKRRTPIINTALIGMELGMVFIQTESSFVPTPQVTISADPVFTDNPVFTI